MKTDTIVAVASSFTESGIGIIRISGEDAIPVTNKIYYNKFGKNNLTEKNTHTINYGFIINNIECENIDNWKEYIVDEVMVSIMKAPNSFTTEDTIEINCHGGLLVMDTIIKLLIANGIRIAEPGEFTKRAFLNGRIDLTKAEAIMDLINAQNETSLNYSMNHLKGKLNEKILELRNKLIYEIAYIESALDDPEHISLEGYHEVLEKKLDNLIKELDNLIISFHNGKLVKEGINTVIIGKPNAGKSSLLNSLIGEERAIVTEVAGTTRDIIQETININGITLNIIDTAGIRDTDDTVEKIGVEKAKEYAVKSDLIIYVVDASSPLTKEDLSILSIIKDKNIIILLNKIDINCVIKENEFDSYCNDNRKIEIIKTSIQENIGIKQLENVINEMFFNGEIKNTNEVVITNIRHKEKLNETKESLEFVLTSIKNNMPEDFLSIDLMNAYISLGSIIGEEIGEDLVEEIFSKFCMGK